MTWQEEFDEKWISTSNMNIKKFIAQTLISLADQMEGAVGEDVKQVDGDWEMKPVTKDTPEEDIVYCLTCGAFYYEGACTCRAYNSAKSEVREAMAKVRKNFGITNHLTKE